jgi:hypothetical protein
MYLRHIKGIFLESQILLDKKDRICSIFLKVQGWKRPFIFASFIFLLAGVTHPSNPEMGMGEPWVIEFAPWLFFFGAIGGTLWLFSFGGYGGAF